jgi:hypothetical protein
LKRLRRIQLFPDLPQQVEQALVDLVNGSGPVIPEHAIDGAEGFSNVSTISPIHNLQLFGGMQVVKRKRPLRRRCAKQLRSGDGCESGKSEKRSTGKQRTLHELTGAFQSKN